MKKKFFEENELLELEALEVKGGDRADPMAQQECVNTVAGCGASADQIRCVNEVLDCGSKPSDPKPNQSPCVVLNPCSTPISYNDCPK